MTYPTTPHVAGSDTSAAAAESVSTLTGEMRLRVYRAIESAGERGMTDQEVQISLRMSPNTQRPRRRELEQAGLVRKAGKTRPTRSGRAAEVWVIGDGRKPPTHKTCGACGGSGKIPIPVGEGQLGLFGE